MALGAFAIAMTPASFGVAGYVVPIAVLTAGYALFQTANNTVVMADVPADQRGLVSGLLSLSRNHGLITGASVMGAVFASASSSASGTSDITTATAEAIAGGMRTTFAVSAVLIVLALGLASFGTRRASMPRP